MESLKEETNTPILGNRLLFKEYTPDEHTIILFKVSPFDQVGPLGILHVLCERFIQFPLGTEGKIICNKGFGPNIGVFIKKFALTLLQTEQPPSNEFKTVLSCVDTMKYFGLII